MKQLDVPVALIFFRRPATLTPVFAAIAAARPRRLYLIADGPRLDRPDDAPAVAAARAIVERVDWPCEVVRLYAAHNLGLRLRVESGLNALFAAEERAIILEDDCVPDPSFFPFCAELLDRFVADERVAAIAGNNFQPRPPTAHSYYFSRYPHCWGWATWARAWACYDSSMSAWPRLREQGWLATILPDRQACRYWRHVFDAVYAANVDSWAYRWTYSCWLHSALTALPHENLVSNIGFGADASNTSAAGSPFAGLQTRPIVFPLNHQPTVARAEQADHYTERTLFSRSLWTRLSWRVRRLLRRRIVS